MRNRNTIEFLGIWERLNNSHFKPLEFEGFKMQAGLNSFTLTAKQWIEATNAIGQQEPQSERLRKLNQIAIQQMPLLTADLGVKRLNADEK